jgi:pheromone shutdown protein TraB
LKALVSTLETYKVKNWFQSFCFFMFNLYRYTERDTILAHTMREEAAREDKPGAVVAVVGADHVPGGVLYKS